MSRTSRTAALRAVPLFTAFADKELSAVAKVIEVVDVKADEVLVTQGQRGHEFYVIAEGTADVVRDGAKVASLSAGQWFGELAVLNPQPRNATVTMTTAGQVLILSEREFFSLLATAPSLSRKLLIGLASRLHSEDSIQR